MEERIIICKDLNLLQSMTVLRLIFEEQLPQQEGCKPIWQPFTEDYILADYKVKGKIPPKWDKDGNLIHQNPVFLSGHFRSSVVEKLCAKVCGDFYPGRRPHEVASSFKAFHIKAGKLVNDQENNLAENYAAAMWALKDIRHKFSSEEYSEASLAFYRSLYKVLGGFGRGEFDITEDE